ncbi:probable G-protein coupled receptor 19 [Hydractinia symbiolongicarpus]|uniref:probable G-protein coupled receptor 19 n=1 Tax=Hydractinia symbiolongicarpus TaxID=13093 RepID=UPI00254F055E|nr:probable G-protein coupled receptor 19 [Hydractinia symbiolongicarpus]
MNNLSYGKEWLKTTYGDQTLELSIFSILICFAVFGNILTLLVVHKSRRLLWSTNILVGHLAMAHLVLTGVSSSVYIYWKVSRWNLIISYYFSNFSNYGMSAIPLAYMALDRYYVIVYPLAVHMTREYTIKILTIGWLLALAFSCPLFHFVKDRENFFGLFCSKNKTCLAWRTYLCIYFLVFIVSSLLCISVLNIKIFWTIYQREDNEILPLSKIAPARERLRKLGRGPVPATKQKSVKMLLVLNIYFALSWLPYFTYSVCSITISRILRLLQLC